MWLDPNFRAKLWDSAVFTRTMLEVLAHVDTLLPNEEDGRLLTGETEPRAVGAKLGWGVRRVVLKAGERGAYVFTAKGGCIVPGST